MSLTKVTYSMINGASVNVLDYGAIGDGTTDDTAAIQAAINAVGSAGGGAVYLPAGSYKLTATLTVTQNKTYIYGDGTGATILTRSTDYGNTLNFTGNDATGVLLTDVGVSNLAFYSTGLTTSGAHIRANGVWRMTINDIFMLQGFVGFLFRGLLASTINNVYLVFTNLFGGSTPNRKYMVFDSTVNTYSHPSSGDVFVNNFNLRGNTTFQITDYGVQIVSADGIWFENGHLGNCVNANIHIAAVTSEMVNLVFFTNVMSDEGLSYGLSIEGNVPSVNRKLQFTNCMFKSGGTPAYADIGINIAPGCTIKEVLFANCVVTEYGQSGVSIASSVCKNIDFTGCQVFWNGRETAGTYPGYNLLGGANNIRITGGMSGDETSQAYGIQLATGHSNILITGVDLTGNDLGSVNGFSSQVQFSNCNIQGSIAVASDSTVTPISGRNIILVTGTTTINNIATLQAGDVLTLQFTSVLTVKDGTGNLQLNGDFVTSTDDTLTLIYNGAVWAELSRSTN